MDETDIEQVSKDPENVAHYSVEFFTEQKELQIPHDPLNVPGNVDSDQLNSLLLQLNAAEEGGGDKNESNILYDFLINKLLLRVTIEEFIREHNLSSENVIRIECVKRQPPPTSDFVFPTEDWVSAVRVTKNCIFASCYDKTVRVWDNKTGQEKLKLSKHHTDSIKCLAVLAHRSDNNEYFVTGGLDQLLLHWKYDTKTHQAVCLRSYRGHERSVECCTSNSEGNRLASGSFDGHLKIWNCDLTEIDNDEPQKSKRAKKVEKETEIENVTPMVTLAGHRENISAVCWSPTNEAECVTASFDQSIIVWDLELAGQKSSLSGSRAFTSLSICPTTQMILTSSVDKHIRLWDTRNKEGSMVRRVFTSHQGWVSDVSWSPNDSNLFVSCGYDGIVKMWDIRSPLACLYDMVGHKEKALSVDWSMSNKIASGGCDNTVRVYTHNEAK